MRDLVRGRPRSHGGQASSVAGRDGLQDWRTPGPHRAPAPVSFGPGAGAIPVPLVLQPKLGTRDCPCIGHGRGRRVRWETGE